MRAKVQDIYNAVQRKCALELLWDGEPVDEARTPAHQAGLTAVYLAGYADCEEDFAEIDEFSGV